MNCIVLFPNPKPKGGKQAAIRKLDDGAEQCNLRTKKGRASYEDRKRAMWKRQGHMCCLYTHIASCPGPLSLDEATFDHEIPRGHGGGFRDDRIEIKVRRKDGTVKIKWQNGAAHALCNYLKGSRRISYNAAHNDAA